MLIVAAAFRHFAPMVPARRQAMFCPNCYVEANDVFCCHCGTRITPAPQGPPPLAIAADDWHDEVRYNVLLHFEEVRDLLARYSDQASKGISGEAFMEIYDRIMKPLTGVSMTTVMAIAKPIYTRLGIQTGKRREETLPLPAGKTLVAALCSMARHGWTIKHVHQAEDGCILEASLPSDLRSLEGELVITVRREHTRTHVDAVTKIPGQRYDWGKSAKCLNELFDDLVKLAA
jgi:hypothetical protein